MERECQGQLLASPQCTWAVGKRAPGGTTSPGVQSPLVPCTGQGAGGSFSLSCMGVSSGMQHAGLRDALCTCSAVRSPAPLWLGSAALASALSAHGESKHFTK
ncbi:unnamed protein product [Lepidochelys kempii]